MIDNTEHITRDQCKRNWIWNIISNMNILIRVPVYTYNPTDVQMYIHTYTGYIYCIANSYTNVANMYAYLYVYTYIYTLCCNMTVYNSYMRLYKNLAMHAYIRIFSYGYIGLL